ncbi:MAG: hypothetical protein V1799_05715 [bacterium]
MNASKVIYMSTLILSFPFILVGQPSLDWINRTSTKESNIFNSRIFFFPDYLFHPLSRYQYYIFPDDEFEEHKLKENQKSFQLLFASRWKNGFLLQIPIDVGNKLTNSSYFQMGVYDFRSESFPLRFVGGNLDFPLYREDVDQTHLQNVSQAKGTKYAYPGRGAIRLRSSKPSTTFFSLKVPKHFAEIFKSGVISEGIGIQLIIDFENSISYSSAQKPTNHFKEQIGIWKFNKINEQALNTYLKEFGKVFGRPMELIQCLNLTIKIRGFRIVDYEQIILFEWIDNLATPGLWKIDSKNSTFSDQLIIAEQPLDTFISQWAEYPWHRETIISSYSIDKNQVSKQEWQSFLSRDLYNTRNGFLTSTSMSYLSDEFSWWDCDFYLKRIGKRLPSNYEIRQAVSDKLKSTNSNNKAFITLINYHNEICNNSIDFNNREHLFISRNETGRWSKTEFDIDDDYWHWSNSIGFRGVHH